LSYTVFTSKLDIKSKIFFPSLTTPPNLVSSQLANIEDPSGLDKRQNILNL